MALRSAGHRRRSPVDAAHCLGAIGSKSERVVVLTESGPVFPQAQAQASPLGGDVPTCVSWKSGEKAPWPSGPGQLLSLLWLARRVLAVSLGTVPCSPRGS